MKPNLIYNVIKKNGIQYYIFAKSHPVTVVGTSSNGGIKVEGNTIKEALQEAFEGMKAHLD
ncbi:hypothetical protein MKX67_18255 [Cytobacillus sp. FSL W7-1323]|uniref:hypothetical protein n=1 Tax=Cytobacillus sp. FSL W7-1323 TaxID=2921700 RepID=UPI0031594CE4